jgi:hypothetical protein
MILTVFEKRKFRHHYNLRIENLISSIGETHKVFMHFDPGSCRGVTIQNWTGFHVGFSKTSDSLVVNFGNLGRK